jgi:hypothetical protein
MKSIDKQALMIGQWTAAISITKLSNKTIIISYKVALLLMSKLSSVFNTHCIFHDFSLDKIHVRFDNSLQFIYGFFFFFFFFFF